MARTAEKKDSKKDSKKVGQPQEHVAEGRSGRVVWLKIAGLVLAAFSIFTLVSVVSYFFTWQVDQSLSSNPEMMSRSVGVSNLGGKLGFQWGRFLVARCFGFGSLAIICLLFVASVKLFFRKNRWSFPKTLVLTLTAAVISSVILAFCASLVSENLSFEGGLGGDCGAFVSSWLVNVLGDIFTGLILLILVVLWLLYASGGFSKWFADLGEKDKAPRQKRQKKERKAGRRGASERSADVNVFASGSDGNVVSEDGHQAASESSDHGQSGSDDAGTAGADSGQDSSERTPGQGSSEKVPGQGSSEKVPGQDSSEKTAGQGSSEKTPAQGELKAAAGQVETDSPANRPDAADGTRTDGQMEVVDGQDLNVDVKKELPRIDTREELSKYNFPPMDLLKDYEDLRHEVSREELERNNAKIRLTLQNYGIGVERVFACKGPVVTLYKVVPSAGVRISSIRSREEDIALSLGQTGVRVVTLQDVVGIEVPNAKPSIVPLKSLFNDPAFRENKYELPVAMGYTISQKVKVFDLTNAPHLLVAGATQQGKSVGLNVIITSLLYAKHPSEMKLVFIDPKMVEFNAYGRLLKHYLAVLPTAANEEEERENAIVKTPKGADDVLKSLCREMDERYRLMSKAMTNKVTMYNEKFKDRRLNPENGHRYLPYLVVVIDEYADLLMSDSKQMSKSISTSIVRLAQKGRAAGIHVILATQRPTVDVVTGLIKTNFPMRIAFRTSAKIDSQTILDKPGAERLIGKGDMLLYSGVEMERMQCAMIGMDEISDITEFIGSQTGYKQCYNTPFYLPMPESEGSDGGSGSIDMQNLDEMFKDAAEFVVIQQKGSTSLLQRKFGVGFARAGKIMDQLEGAGVVGPQDGSKPRQVLIQDLDTLKTEVFDHFLK